MRINLKKATSFLSTALIVQGYDVSIRELIEKMTKIERTLGTLPCVVDDIAKKYSTYLHDEHMQIYETVQKKTIARAGYEQKTAPLPPSPRVYQKPPIVDISLFKDAPSCAPLQFKVIPKHKPTE